MNKCYFITGTDTAIGKTVVSVALLQIAKRKGFIAAGYKPIASGSEIFSEGLRNNDVLQLQKNSSLTLTYQDVNAYTFFEPTSPNIVSKNECIPIHFSVLSKKLRTLEDKANWILVEGAGGWFTPLSERKTFADWVLLEQLPVILVVGIKLGCINHAILTEFAIRKSGLHLEGWIANNISEIGGKYEEYIFSLKKLLSAPLLGEIPWLKNEVILTNVERYFNLNALNDSVL